MNSPRILSLLAILCAVSGLVCVVMWTDLVGQHAAFVEAANALQGIPNARVLCLGGQISASLLCVACPHALRHWDRPLIIAVVGLYGLAVMSSASSGEHTQLAAAVGCLVLAGIGYTAIAIYLLSHLARLVSFTRALALILTALAAEAIALPLVNLLHADARFLVGMVGVPLLAALCSLLLPRLIAAIGPVGDLAEMSKRGREDSQRLIAALATIAILRASVRALGSMGFWDASGSSPTVPDCLLSGGLLILFAWPTLALYRNDDPFNCFLPAFLVVLGGFFLVDPSFVVSQWLSGRLMFLESFVESFTYAMYWCVIVVAIRQLPMHPYRIAGIAFLLFSGFSLPLVCTLAQSDALAGPLVMLVQYGFIVVLGITALTARASSRHAAVPPNSDDALKELARDRRLSPRETEVFVLLAQGRSRSYIEKELFIAEGTVKTHTSRIYQKFGVSSKQELISLVHDEKRES